MATAKTTAKKTTVKTAPKKTSKTSEVKATKATAPEVTDQLSPTATEAMSNSDKAKAHKNLLKDITKLQASQEVLASRAEDPPGTTYTMMHRLLITITRDPMTKIPKHVYQHELPLWEMLEGEDKISVEREKDVEVKDFDVEAEYDRLVRQFGQNKDGKNVAVLVYGINPTALAQELGIYYKPTVGARVARKAPQSLQVGGED